jgi:peptide/nickel transport system ATP-binding protein
MNSSGITDLTIDYRGAAGAVRILDCVSLSIPQGSIVGLIGESGSGKSTLGLAMLGLLAANVEVVSGQLRIDGRSLPMNDRHAMVGLRGRTISMIFQDPLGALNPVFTIGNQLDEVQHALNPLMRSSTRRARALEALDAVGLPDPVRALRHYPHELSGGMRQRVVIAMAMLAEARIVVADEPTTALDPEFEQQVMTELLRLKDRIGCSIVLISHSLGLVSRLCDTVHVMLSGRIIEEGPSAQVIGSPSHDYTRQLLACDVNLHTPRLADTQSFHFPVIDRSYLEKGS